MSGLIGAGTSIYSTAAPVRVAASVLKVYFVSGDGKTVRTASGGFSSTQPSDDPPPHYTGPYFETVGSLIPEGFRYGLPINYSVSHAGYSAWASVLPSDRLVIEVGAQITSVLSETTVTLDWGSGSYLDLYVIGEESDFSVSASYTRPFAPTHTPSVIQYPALPVPTPSPKANTKRFNQ
jgi:hypothetical protein